MIYRVDVDCLPVPKGNIRMARGRYFDRKAPQLKAMREAIVLAWKRKYAPGVVAHGGVTVCVAFFLPRPKRIPKGRTVPTVKPDLDKLARAVLDCLTGLAYADDAQVVSLVASKEYATESRRAGLRVRVRSGDDVLVFT